MGHRFCGMWLLWPVALLLQPAWAEPGPEPSIDWQARVVLAHEQFNGLHAEPAAAATWLRRAELGARLAHGPWRLDLNTQRGNSGRWDLDEWRISWRSSRAAPQGWALAAGRFDPAFGLEPSSGAGARLAPEASPVWDGLPELDDADGAELLALHRWWPGEPGLWSLQASGLHRDGRKPQWQLRLTQGGDTWLAGLSWAHQGDVADDGRLRSRGGVRGTAEHPRGRRLTLAPRGEVTHAQAWGLDLTLLRAPWWASLELVGRSVQGPDAHLALGAVALWAWSPGGGMRRVDALQGRLRAPPSARGDAAATTWFIRSSWLDVSPGGRLQETLAGVEWRWPADVRLQLALAHVRGQAHDAPMGETGRSLVTRLEWWR